MRGFRKERNMRANPHVTLLVYDPRHPLHHIEIRGTVVDLTEEGALEHLKVSLDAIFKEENARDESISPVK